MKNTAYLMRASSTGKNIFLMKVVRENGHSGSSIEDIFSNSKPFRMHSKIIIETGVPYQHKTILGYTSISHE